MQHGEIPCDSELSVKPDKGGGRMGSRTRRPISGFPDNVDASSGQKLARSAVFIRTGTLK
jgi:hypothetical protein